MKGARSWITGLLQGRRQVHNSVIALAFVVSLFKLEQAVTEVTIMEVAAGGRPVRKRKKYINHERKLMTISRSTRRVITPSVNL